MNDRQLLEISSKDAFNALFLSTNPAPIHEKHKRLTSVYTYRIHGVVLVKCTCNFDASMDQYYIDTLRTFAPADYDGEGNENDGTIPNRMVAL